MGESIYDSLLQFFTVSWAKFIAANYSRGREVRDDFQNVIYAESVLWMWCITILLAGFYYYYLNVKFGRYYTSKNWLVILVINSLFVGITTYLRANTILNDPGIDVSQHLLCLSMLNTAYSAILFIFISIIIKKKSPMGKKTPRLKSLIK